jgi:hypothetical protein
MSAAVAHMVHRRKEHDEMALTDATAEGGTLVLPPQLVTTGFGADATKIQAHATKIQAFARQKNAKKEVARLRTEVALQRQRESTAQTEEGLRRLTVYLLFVFVLSTTLVIQKNQGDAFKMHTVVNQAIVGVDGFDSINTLEDAWRVYKDIISLLYAPGDNVLDGHSSASLMDPSRDQFRGLPNRCACCDSGGGDMCTEFVQAWTPVSVEGTVWHRRTSSVDLTARSMDEAALCAENLQQGPCCTAYDWCSECEQCGGSVPSNTTGHVHVNLPSGCRNLSLRSLQEGLFNLHHTTYGVSDATGGYIFEHFRHLGPFLLKQRRYQTAECRTTHDFYPKCLGTAESTDDIDLTSTDHHSSHVIASMTEALKNERLQHAFAYDELFQAFVFEGDPGIFSYPLEVVSCQLEMLHDSEWAGRQTSDLELSLFLYNGNVDVYIFVDFTTHFGLTGVVETDLIIKAVAVRDMYSSSSDYARAALEAIVVCALVFEVFAYGKCIIVKFRQNTQQRRQVHANGAKEIVAKRNRQKDQSMVLLLDTLSIVFCFAQVICWTVLVARMQAFSLPPLEDERMENHWIVVGSAAKLIEIVDLWTQYVYINTSSLVLCTFRVFFFFEFHKRLSFATAVFRKTANELAHFSIVFVILNLFYAFIGHNIFGEESAYFSSIGIAFSTMMHLFIADIIWVPEDLQHNYFFGLAFFWSFIGVSFFILFNVVLSIIVDGYIAVKGEADKTDSIFDTVKTSISAKTIGLCRKRRGNGI